MNADTIQVTGSICIHWLWIHKEEVTLLVTQSNSENCDGKLYSLRKSNKSLSCRYHFPV